MKKLEIKMKDVKHIIHSDQIKRLDLSNIGHQNYNNNNNLEEIQSDDVIGIDVEKNDPDR